MRLFGCIALVAVVAGCVDQKTCHQPAAWKPCPNTRAEPGASGTPPAIVELSLPTCVYVDTPVAMGSLHVSDPDGDATVVKATFFQGVRNNESELPLDAAHRSGTEWSGSFAVTLVGGGASGMLTESTDDVMVKVVDAAGAQSVPYCNTIAALR